MTAPPRIRASTSALAQLMREPQRFRFDAAIRLLMRAAGRAEPGDVARFRTPPGLAFTPADITAIEPGDSPEAPLQVSVGVISMAGASGVLPRFYTELISATLRGRSRALHDFIDMLGHRLVALYARAGSKYRLHRAVEVASLQNEQGQGRAEADPVSLALLSLTGYGSPDLAGRVLAGTDPLMHYAGLFATRPRSADRLATLLSDWLGRPVQVMQFAGAWLDIPPDGRTALSTPLRGGRWNRLGVDAVAGVRAWDVQARIVLRIGPLDHASFASLLPDRSDLAKLVSLVRCFLGFETGFAVNPVLAAAEVPKLHLDAAHPARLGWNTWLPTTAPRRRNGEEPLFEAESVERQTLEVSEHV